MLEIKRKTSFKKEIKKIKDPKVLSELKEIISTLIDGKPLDAKYKPHPLHGEYKSYMDCHVKHDVVLVYKIDGKYLWLYKIGSHSDIFG